MNGLWPLADDPARQFLARFLVAALALVCGVATAWADTRVALVIGNAAYADTTPLANTRNDATAVAAKLTAIGFDVALYQDLDGQSFRVALGEFSEKAQGADLAIVYYAGHGIEMNGQNYLIPVDARMRSEATAAFETVALDQVIGAVREAGVLGMVMLDACRNNPFATTMQRKNGTRAVSRGLAPISVEGETGLVVSFAAEAGQTADDGDTGHSPYAAALLEVLDQPGLEVGRMFRSVRAKVRTTTDGRQVPIEQMQLPDAEIYLVAAPAPTGGTTEGTAKDMTSRTTEDPMVIYMAAVRSGDPRQLESYLSRFPTHERADEARRILLDYADDDLWASIVERDTPRDYRVYLMAFPTGRHLAEAQARLDALEVVANPQPPAEPTFQVFGNLDLIGGDLSATGIRGISFDDCQAQCLADGACMAFTYVQAKQWCWTKGSIGAREIRPGMISALKVVPTQQGTQATPEPVATATKTLRLYADLDILGHDLTDAGIKNISIADCEAWCRANTTCSGFSYVQKQNWCWPKYSGGATAPTSGIISGQLE
jgi:uncharacterized caspase-like protein